MITLDELIKNAANFVEKQQGMWDHNAWLNFISDAQKKGVQLSEEMQSYIGGMLEAMKKIYQTQTMEDSNAAISETMASLSSLTADFIKKTKGIWDHTGWEDFITELQQKGISLTEETREYIGEVLESAKEFYKTMPATELTKEPKTTVKASSKEKTTASKAKKPKPAGAAKPVKKKTTKKSTA